MNKEQWQIIRDDILKFNRLVTTPEERKTEAYILKCYDLLDEEYSEVREARNNLSQGGSTVAIEFLDGLADTTVTAVQAVDAITPSQLEWECIEGVLIGFHTGSRHYLVDHIGTVVDEAYYHGFDIVGAMSEVSRSNLSKVPLLSDVLDHYGPNVESALAAESDWIETNRVDLEGNPRYTGVHGEVVLDSEGVERAVYRDSNRKVMKSFFFSEPDLTPYI